MNPKKDNSTIARLRFHTHNCGNCRYHRQSKNGSPTNDCLLLGRMMGIGEYNDLNRWAKGRVCDFWLKRPKRWQSRLNEGINPFWNDPYISRESLKKIRKRRGLE